MWRFRLLLLPIGAIAELSILATCWVVAVFSKQFSMRMHDWATSTLPSLDWYIGNR